MNRGAVGLVALLVVAACSSGDDVGSPTSTEAGAPTSVVAPPTTADTPSTTTATAPPTTGPTATVPASTTATSASPGDDRPLGEAELAERDLAGTALLTVDDFPDGWVESPTSGDDDDPTADRFEEEFDACLGRDPDQRLGEELDRIAAQTGDFHPPDDDSVNVSHEVALAGDEATATARMADVDVSGSEACVADVLLDFYVTLAETEPDLAGIDIGEIVVTRTELEFEPDQRVGVLIEIPLSVDGQSVSQFLEFVYQRDGRALSELTFSSFGQPFARDGYTALTARVADLLAAVG